jgi:cation:H+ antiporter
VDRFEEDPSMSIWVLSLLILTGLALLKFGADWFVSGSAGLARKLRISELAIGLTIVAFGTSAPELVVNSFASVRGNDDIVFGNVIGSNNFNLFIILGIVGIMSPVRVKSSTAWKEIPFSMIALVILFMLANDRLIRGKESSGLTRGDGIIMFLFFLLFLLYVFRQLKKDQVVLEAEGGELSYGRITLLIITGLALLIAGGKLVLDNAVKLAIMAGISEKIIGLTIVAAGTSLPELATSVVAATKRNHDIAVGNIIGSNIFNILFILPVSSMISPLSFSTGFNTDMAVLAGGTLLLLTAMVTGRRQCIDRWEAFVLLGVYIVYMGISCSAG